MWTGNDQSNNKDTHAVYVLLWTLNLYTCFITLCKLAYRIKMEVSPINLWYMYKQTRPQFQYFLRKLDKSMCTSDILSMKSTLMIDINGKVIRYQIEKLRYVNKYKHNATIL